jgi:secondary thiamine-phosphate synthase enzyme
MDSLMRVITETISVSPHDHTHIIDLTDAAAKKLSAADLSAGTVTFFVPGATAAVTTIEYEPGLIKDIPELYEKIAPEDKTYHHDETWGDHNGSAHLRAALQGPSLVVPFSQGRMMLGTWQQVVLIDFDNRPRQRTVILQIMGV